MSSGKLDINELHDRFTAEIKAIEAITDATEKKQRVLYLRKEIEDVSHLLPTYQRNTYSDKVQALLSSVPDEPTKRRSRFTGKSKSTARAKPQRDFKDEEITPTLTNATGQVYRITDQKPLITNIQKCVIITDTTSTSATFKNVRNSVVIIEAEGPVFLHDCHNCLMYITAHQLRIHDSTKLRIQARTASGRAVIEHCKDMSFDGVEVDDFDHPNGGSDNFVIQFFTVELTETRNKPAEELLQCIESLLP